VSVGSSSVGCPGRALSAGAPPTIVRVIAERQHSSLSARQELVLRRLVADYPAAGAPLGSKPLASGVAWGPSTIRHEHQTTDEMGLLAPPHTSAGQVPTEPGDRYYVAALRQPLALFVSVPRHVLARGVVAPAQAVLELVRHAGCIGLPSDGRERKRSHSGAFAARFDVGAVA